jgi:hypothetical protein
MPTIDEAFAAYRSKYPMRPPDTSEIAYDDETRQLTPEEGLKNLKAPPCADIVTSSPPTKDGEAAAQKYLWVVLPKSIPFALELLPNMSFKRGRLAHTNLTGGCEPTPDWKGRESFTNDFFVSEDVPISRRGYFSLYVIEAMKDRLISVDSAASYLQISNDEIQSKADAIRDLFGQKTQK